MADHQMNSPVRKPTAGLPSDAATRIKAAQSPAEKKLADALDAFWQNCPRSKQERVSPLDLVPLFGRYAGALFNAHAEEYRTLSDDDDTREQFLRRELPEIVVNEILSPTGGSKSPGSFDGIGLRESLGMYRDRIDVVVRSAARKPKEIWEYPGYGEIPDEEFSERYLGEGPGFDLGFSEAEGTWERLTDDACDGAIQARSYFPYSRAMVWALRDEHNRSEVEKLLLVSLQEQWRDFVASRLDQAAKSTLVDVSPSGARAPAPPPQRSTGERHTEAGIPNVDHVGGAETTSIETVGKKKRGRPQTIPDAKEMLLAALPAVGNRETRAGSKMSATRDTNERPSDQRDSVNMANTMQAWPRLSPEALHRIESAEGDASKVLADSVRPYTPGNPNWVRNRDNILEGGYRVIDFIAAYAEAVFNAHSAEYDMPGSSGVFRDRIAPLVRRLVNWPWMAWIFSTSVVGRPFSEQPLPWKKRKPAPGQWEIPSPQALRLRYPSVKSVRISIADKPIDPQLAGGLAELQKRFSTQIEGLLEERISHWEKSASGDKELSRSLAQSSTVARNGAAKRFASTVTSTIAVQRMDAYLKSKVISLSNFAGQVDITDRTLRSFRRTGKVRRDIFDAIAKAMGTTKEELLKPE